MLFQKNEFYAVLFLVALEKVTEIIVSYLANESGFHSEDGSAGDGVGSRASRYELNAHRLEGLPYLVACLHIDMLHASLWKMELLKEPVIGQDGQNVRQSVSYA